jgi:hypothetical protein
LTNPQPRLEQQRDAGWKVLRYESSLEEISLACATRNLCSGTDQKSYKIVFAKVCAASLKKLASEKATLIFSVRFFWFFI